MPVNGTRPRLSKARFDFLVARGEEKFKRYLIDNVDCPETCQCLRCFDAALEALVNKSETALQEAYSNDSSIDPVGNYDSDILSAYPRTD